jgi:hypothetical protein
MELSARTCEFEHGLQLRNSRLAARAAMARMAMAHAAPSGNSLCGNGLHGDGSHGNLHGDGS